MTFTKAILFAAKGNYGILTPEIQKIAKQVSWGSSVNDALSTFAKRVNTKLINRTISLIIESSKSGGNVADVLDAASQDAREIKLIEAERRTTMASYVVVIYVGMFVFLVIVMVLCKQFLPAIAGEGSSQLQSAMGSGGGIAAEDITQVFFYATMMQGFFSGLVAGVFEDGNLSSGVKHMFIIVFISWVLFKFVVGV
jgi:flagellar protein FlaJ